MRLKRLNLWQWMINYATGCQGLPLHPHFQMLFERELPYMEKRHAFIGEVSLPNGSYLKGKDCFFVVNNHAYKQDIESFTYELNLLNSMERLPSGRLITLLSDAETAIYGKPTDNTLTMIKGIETWKRQLRTKTESSRRIKQMRARVLNKNHASMH